MQKAAENSLHLHPRPRTGSPSTSISNRPSRRDRPIRSTTASSAKPSWKVRPHTVPSSSPLPHTRCTSCTRPPRRRSTRWGTPTTSICSPNVPSVPVLRSGEPGERVRDQCVCSPPIRDQCTRPSGRLLGRPSTTTSRWFPPTIARSAGPSRVGPPEAAPWRLLQDSQWHARRRASGWRSSSRGGVNQGQIGLNRFVEITTTPAKMFGMYPKKGTIAPGGDADIVVFDPDGRTVIWVGDPAHPGRLLGLRGPRSHRRGRVRALPGTDHRGRRGSTKGRPEMANSFAGPEPVIDLITRPTLLATNPHGCAGFSGLD